MALTVKRAGADDYGKWIRMLAFGNPGAGKTRTASTWPDVLYANCEGGLMSVADRQPATIDITHSSQMKELMDALGQTPAVRERLLGVPVQTVVIDTIDEVAKILVQERLKDERKDAFAIQDWGWLGDQLRNMVRGFRNLDMNVIFNVHLKSQEDSETGHTYFKAAIQGSMGDEIAAYVDLALLLVAKPVTRVVDGKNVRTVQRYFQTFQDAQHPWVKDRSGRLPMEFTVNFDDDYERMHRIIYSSVPSAGSTLATVATPDAPAPAAAPARTTGPAKSDPQQPLPDQPPAAETPAEAAPAPEPAPEPEVVPEPTPEPEIVEEAQVEPEPTPTVPDPEPAPEPEESVPDSGTPDPEPETSESTAVQDNPDEREPWETCASCGGKVESKDQADLAFIRHKEHLCRSCFAERKAKKK